MGYNISNQSWFKNPVVKSYILSESLLWSAWNGVIPLFAVFVTTKVQGGTVETAGIAYSLYLIVRVAFELYSGKLLVNSSDRKKFIVSVVGIVMMSLAYVGFVFSYNLWIVFIFYGLLGAGLGLASPAKNSLFSTHLDKNKEANEWASLDAITFFFMAIAAAIGGVITKYFGFDALFILASIINLISIFPYVYKRHILY